MNFQKFKMDLEKAEELEIKLLTSVRSSKKQESSRKTSTSALLTMPMTFTAWITTKCGKFFKRWEYQTTLPASWEICMQVKKQQLDRNLYADQEATDMEHRLVQNWEWSMSRLYIVTLLIQLIGRVHHAKCRAGWSTSWHHDCWEKYQKPQGLFIVEEKMVQIFALCSHLGKQKNLNFLAYNMRVLSLNSSSQTQLHKNLYAFSHS